MNANDIIGHRHALKTLIYDSHQHIKPVKKAIVITMYFVKMRVCTGVHFRYWVYFMTQDAMVDNLSVEFRPVTSQYYTKDTGQIPLKKRID